MTRFITSALGVSFMIVTIALASPVNIASRENPLSNILVPPGCTPTPDVQGQCTLFTLTPPSGFASVYILDHLCVLAAYEPKVKVGQTAQIKMRLENSADVTIGDRGKELVVVKDGFKMDAKSSRRLCKVDDNGEWLCKVWWNCMGAAKLDNPVISG